MRSIAVGALAATVLAAATASAPAGSPDRARVGQNATLLAQVSVTASDSKFVLSAKSARRGVVVFRVTNVGALKHDFEIKRRKTKLLSHGQSDTLRVTFLRKGQYPYKSTQAGDAARGLNGVFSIK